MPIAQARPRLIRSLIALFVAAMMIAAAALPVHADEKPAKKVKTHVVIGVLKSVDAAAGAMVVEVKPVAGKPAPKTPEQTLKIATDCKVTFNGEAAKVADLKVGMTLTCGVDPEENVRTIRVYPPAP